MAERVRGAHRVVKTLYNYMRVSVSNALVCSHASILQRTENNARVPVLSIIKHAVTSRSLSKRDKVYRLQCCLCEKQIVRVRQVK